MNIQIFLSLFFYFSNALSFGNRRLTELDKSHLKNYANNWIDVWKTNPTPLTDVRINECWKSIIWCTTNRYKHNAHCLFYKRQNFFIFVCENERQNELSIEGILENPENIYTSKQMDDVYTQLELLSNASNYTLNIKPLRNWSHGFYFYEYQ